jgi:hypothetical protein
LNTKIIRNHLAGSFLAGAILLAGCGGPQAATTLLPPTATTGPAIANTDEAAGTSPAAVRFEWTVEIVQGGAVLPEAAGAVALARAPFTIRASMAQPVAVKLNAFNTDQNFKVLRTGYVFAPDCQDAFCTGMDVAEERLNPEQDLFVDPQLTHYLYYLGPDDHRWSRADVSAEGAVLERDVARLNGAPIEQYAEPALYLMLLANPANEDLIDPGELKTLVLNFQ